MKWFLSILGGLLLSVIIALIVVVLLVVDKPNPPVDQYEANEHYTLTEGAEKALGTLFDEPETTPFKFDISEGEVNTLIYNELKKENPNYLVPEVEGSEYFKVIEGFAGLGGIWIDTKTDGLVLVIRVDLKKGITFKTALRLHFKIDFNDDTDPNIASLEVNKIQLGKLKVSAKILNKLPDSAKTDLEKNINKALTLNGISIGEFTFKDLKLKLNKQSLIDAFTKDKSTVYKTILNLLNANQMLDLKLTNEGISLQLTTQKIYNDREMVEVKEADKFQNQAELDRMLETKSTNMLISTLQSEAGRMYVNLSTYEIDRMLEYFFRADLESVESEVKIGSKTLKIEMMAPNISINKDGGMKLIVKVKLYELADPSKPFYTTLITDLIGNNTEGHLEFQLGAVAFGKKLSVTEGEMKDILSLVDETNALTESGVLKINNFLENFSNSRNMTSTGIRINDGYIVLEYKPVDEETAAVLASVQTKIKDALGSTLGSDEANPKVKAAYDQIKDKESSEITEEEMNNLIDTIYTELTPEEVDQLKTDIAGELSEDELNRLIQLGGGS